LPGYFNNRLIPPVYPLCLLSIPLCLSWACTSPLNIYNKLSDTEYTSSVYRVILERWTRKGSSIYIFRFKKEEQGQPSKSVELIFTSPPGPTILKWGFKIE
jgi:hypothetical protein